MRSPILVAGVFAAFTLASQAVPAPRSDLDQRLSAADGWVAWQVPASDGLRPACCVGGWRRGLPAGHGCTLDADGLREHNPGTSDEAGAPPAARSLVVYARVTGGVLHQAFAVGDTCPVTEKVPVERIEASTPDSVAVLADAARSAADGDRLVYAIAQHAGEEATQALSSLVTGARDSGLREQAVFWLGHARGATGLAAAEHIALSATDRGLRERAAFAISQSGEAGRLAVLERILAAEPDGGLRRQAWFAVSQTRDPRARDVLETALTDERDTRALQGVVFALSQLPEGEGVPALVALVTRADAPMRVRREALFWLGEAEDPRALTALESILGR